MSEYKIVNRVHPTPAFAQTMAEVEAQVELEKAIPLVKEVIQNPGVLEGLKTEFHVPVPKAGDTMKIPFHAGETIKFVETAEASRAPFVGKTEGEPTAKAIAEIFRNLAKPVTREEFDDFKQQVIAAFKNMGFDTRKFFDE